MHFALGAAQRIRQILERVFVQVCVREHRVEELPDVFEGSCDAGRAMIWIEKDMSGSDTTATVKALTGPKVGHCYSLTESETVIGRDPACDIVIPLASISRRHARIVRDGEDYVIQDLGSLNGTFVNSVRIHEPKRIRGGDHVQIDTVLLSFRNDEAAEAECAARAFEVLLDQPEAPLLRTTAINSVRVLAGDELRAAVDPERKLDAILQIMRGVGTSLDMEEVLPGVLDALFEVFPQADFGRIYLNDGPEGALVTRATKQRQCEDQEPPPSELQGQVASFVFATGKPILQSASVPPDDSIRGIDGRIKALLGIALVTPGNERIGVLELATEDAGRQFIAEDLDLLSDVGSLIGQLAERSRLNVVRRTEAALAREHAVVDRERRLLRTVLDVLPVGVIIADARGRILEANPEAEVLWGGPVPLSIARTRYAQDFPAWRPDTGERLPWNEYGLARALAGSPITQGEELRIETFDHQHRTILSYALPIQDSDEAIVGAVWVVVDITDRKHAELALHLANQRKDRFLAMLAHELRNPLALVRSALALLGRDAYDAESARWSRELMEQQMEHIVRLVDDLLDVSRIARGKIELRKERVEMRRVIMRALEISQPLIDSQRHLLHLALPVEPIWIEADPVRMAQVFANLLNNAAKYTEPEGAIWVEAQAGANQTIVRIRDSGIGISEEMLPHIFDLFSQAKSTVDRAQGGLGIGLSLVRSIVQIHEGSVEAHSEGLGRGCEFTVRLPVADPPAEIEPPSALPAAVNELRVLVVDDHVAQAQILARLLTKLWQHEVEVAHDGPAALEIAARFRPDLILLDIGLPRMDGYEIARRLRLDPALAKTMLVALTGYGQDEHRQRTRDAGFDAHLVKPASVAALEELFRRLNKPD